MRSGFSEEVPLELVCEGDSVLGSGNWEEGMKDQVQKASSRRRLA